MPVTGGSSSQRERGLRTCSTMMWDVVGAIGLAEHRKLVTKMRFLAKLPWASLIVPSVPTRRTPSSRMRGLDRAGRGQSKAL